MRYDPATAVTSPPVTPRARRAPSPDRVDLSTEAERLRPLWLQSAREISQRFLHPIPPIPVRRRAPEPGGADPLIGHLREGVGDPLSAFLRWQQEVGGVARVRLGGVTAHLVSEPQLVREVLKDRHREFVKPIQGRRNLARILGNGLLVSEGDFWLRQRRIIQPAFHKQRVHGFADRMVLAAEDLAREWTQREGAFDVAHDMMRLTLRVVQETLLGVTPSEDADQIGESVSFLIAEINRRFRRMVQAPERWPTPGNRRFARHRDVLDRVVGKIIRQRRAQTHVGDDLLSMLLRTVDEDTGERMDDAQLRDEVMTIFLAGHETTANALSWTFYLLGKHPEAAERMREEIQQVLAGRRATAADYASLTYTRMVFEEAMRLYPPAWILARSPRQDLELGGFLLEGGCRVFLSPWVVHRRADLWPNPEAFDPTRFADPTAIRPFSYFPFGGGRRVCVGKTFAMMEGVLVLATLVRSTHLELVAGHQVWPEALVTLRPRHGVKVIARPVP